MTAYLVPMDMTKRLLAEWAKEYNVYVPAENFDGKYDFLPWEEDIEVAWDYDLAYNSLKRFFFPPQETLIQYDIESYKAEPVFEAPMQLLFGVHPYDLKGINQLDQIMESGSPDVNYVRRRDNTVVFVMDPTTIAPTAFWSSMGADRVDLGFDLYWTKIAPSAYYVEVGSAKGEELLHALGPMPKATLTEREAARRERLRIRAEANKQGLNFPWKETPKILARNWNSSLWRHKARLCLSCGSCVLVCPTCYCFNIREDLDVTLKTGRRVREWGGCMFPSFATVAPDHNFRSQAMDRYRHRYFRKGKYIYDKLGELGCVGCGRCVRACTSGIANPKAVFNELWEAEQHES